MQRSKYDFWVGLFVIVGIVAIVFLALRVGNLASFSFEKTYTVTAQFSNVGSINSGSPVKSAGITVGQVKQVALSNETHQALVTLDLETRYSFPQDSTLKIMTSGLLGEEFLAIVPGVEQTTLEMAAAQTDYVITRTQPSVSIGEVISEIMPGSDGDKPLVGNTFFVSARFTNVGSVKVGSAVKNVGVVVGRVREVGISPTTFEATVMLELESKYNFPSDSSLRIMSSGLIGSQFISLSPGYEEETLEDVSNAYWREKHALYTVTNTQSALVLEDLIGQVLFSMTQNASSSSKSE